MHEVQERYKEKPRKCLHHGKPKWMKIHGFYKGLTSIYWTWLDASAEGAIIKKNENEAYQLLDDMATNNYLWSSQRLPPTKKIVEVYEVDAITKLLA